MHAMAARATRSASRKARATEAVATGPLGALSHDELGVIVDGLADPLQPVVAVALSSTCKGLRSPPVLQAALYRLMQRHWRAAALCRKPSLAMSRDAPKLLRDAEALQWAYKELTTNEMATLGMILRTNGLPRLRHLDLSRNSLGVAGMRALCDGLSHGAAPSLRILYLGCNQLGPEGAAALAAALDRGAMPKLSMLHMGGNPLGNQGVAALVAPLRKLPALDQLFFPGCEIGDEGVASLVANLGKDDFKELDQLWLSGNEITDASMSTLAKAFEAGGLPKFASDDYNFRGFFRRNLASAAAVQAARDALLAMRPVS